MTNPPQAKYPVTNGLLALSVAAYLIALFAVIVVSPILLLGSGCSWAYRKAMKRFLLAVSLLACVSLTGCMGLAKSLQQLKNDPATVDLTITTIYGNIVLHRSVPSAMTNAVGPVTATPLPGGSVLLSR